MSAPDFVYQSGEPMTQDERHAWLTKRCDEAKAKGATWFQFSRHEQLENLVLLEGWKVRPDPCPEPHFQLTAGFWCDGVSSQIKLEPADATTWTVEDLAQWLHDEVEWPEYPYPDRTWPEHEGDTGQRGDGWLKIVPSDVQEQFRDIARRLLTRPVPSQSMPSVPPGDGTAEDRT